MAVTGALLAGEHSLDIPTAGLSALLTIHTLELGGIISGTGVTIADIGFNMIKDAMMDNTIDDNGIDNNSTNSIDDNTLINNIIDNIINNKQGNPC